MILMITVETIFCLITLIPISVSVGLSLQKYFRYKYPHFLIMSVGWFFLFFWVFFQALSYISLEIWFYRISIWSLIPTGILLTILIDSMIRTRLDPIKLIIISILCTLVIFSSLIDGSISEFVFDNGESSYQMVGVLRISQTLLNLFMSILWVYYCIKLYISSPLQIKSIALINLVGGIVLGIITTILIITGITLIIPGIYLFSFGIGILISTYALTKEPKLAFILPFQVIQLIVINSKDGLPIFTHNWAKESISSKESNKDVSSISDSIVEKQTIISGILLGIDNILQSILSSGEITQINLKDRVLMLHRDAQYPLIFVLEATKSSKALKKSLRLFSLDFHKKYSHKYSHPEEINNNTDVTDLVKLNFSFIP
jgi:hypothetical protein